MPSVSNPRVVFNKPAVREVVPGETTVYDTSRTIDLDNVPLHGGYLTKTLVISLEPYMRERMVRAFDNSDGLLAEIAISSATAV